jgi:cysteine desulfurase / selenocysteine lyase
MSTSSATIESVEGDEKVHMTTRNGHRPFDLAAIRRDFPVLKRRVNGDVPLVYLDNAATSQKPVQVIAEITRFYRDHNANIHRGIHALSMEASELYEGAREKVAAFINAPRAEEVVFTRNTTESINLVAYAWGRKFLEPGDEVVITEIEHHSNIVPWQILRDERGITLKHIPMLPDGTLDLETARQVIGPRTKLLAITAMSNALGTIVPLHDYIALARQYGALVLVDGAQSVPHMPVDVQALGADFLAFSAHKMLGPTGVGVLWARHELLEAMDPFMGGGEMILTVSMDHSTWNEVPHKFEAGTPNIAGVIGFAAAIDYLASLGMEHVREHERELVDYALARLSDVPGVTIFGPPDADRRGGVVPFEVEDIHPHDVGQVLDSYGVAVRAGHHCAQPVMAALEVPATVRASFYLYNTRDEIDALAKAVEEASRYFGGPRG